MGADAKTLAFYDENAAEYAPWSVDVSGRELVGRFIALLPKGGAALDLGCGSGWAAADMVAAGLRVQAVDGSAKLAAQALDLYGLEVKVGLFSELVAEDEFDGVWASFSLLHTPRSEMAGNLGRVFRALKDGGRFYLGLKGGTGATRDGLGRFYQLYDTGEITGLLREAGFSGIEITTKASKGYDGTPTPVHHIFARKGTDRE